MSGNLLELKLLSPDPWIKATLKGGPLGGRFFFPVKKSHLTAKLLARVDLLSKCWKTHDMRIYV